MEATLPSVARDLRLRRVPCLEHRNSHRGIRDLDAYRDAAGNLVDRVHEYFTWYYTHGTGLVAGKPPGRAA